ncbi:hypothetical protein GIB67_020453 [Kingdonia uniflora]|uniref:VDE lipocalin domain-containing protein n=1 Tax=Kingdonia uniflora TaxID=39325 RepID=A0A7J7LUV0_9MAGN|nr:hypothetical protein GIB67_020453 [Kingdonia uniflora]
MQYLEAIRNLKGVNGFEPVRTVHISYVPDEEIGGVDGAAKFAKSEEFKSLNVGFMLDEGQASVNDEFRVFYGDRSPWFLIIKGVGMPGHGSKLFDNGAMENLMKSMEVVSKFRENQFDLVKAGVAARSEVISVNPVYVKAGTPSPKGFIMNMQPSEAEAGFDVRLPPTTDPDLLRRRIADEWAPASRNMTYQISEKGPIRDYMGRPMMTPTNDSNPWWSVFQEAIIRIGGKLAKPEILPSTTDARYMRQMGIPTLGFSPMTNTPILLHEHNELLKDSVYLKGITVYESIISSLSSFEGVSFGPLKRAPFHSGSKLSAVLETKENTVLETLSSPVRIVALVGEGSLSPLKNTPWEEVMLHTASRLKWVDEGFEMQVFNDSLSQSGDPKTQNLQREISNADILMIIAVTNPESVKWVQTNNKNIPNIICFDSSPALANKLGGSFIDIEAKTNLLSTLVQSKSTNGSQEVVRTVSDAWERYNSDDIRFCLLVIINAYIRPVSILQNLRSKGFSTLNCMLKNCGRQVLNCLLDPNCRKALQCLNQCSPVDQVCNYRCIASYESPYLEAFSLCVLQKNNCLELDAKIPERPYVTPMAKFRGEDLSHELGEDLFVGWLGNLDWSWRVVAGQNPAYDQFPCQYQLFYRGKAKGSFWYEPVFQVKTLEDGKMVWRRRKYRVRRGKISGTFNFSVLDNGVISKEFWTIVDVSEDLSWGLFHYSGAAQAAGQSYTGAVLVSPDGAYPNEIWKERLISALEKCGIKEWELFMVDNCSCEDPPLGIPDGSSLHSVIEVEYQKQLSV